MLDTTTAFLLSLLIETCPSAPERRDLDVILDTAHVRNDPVALATYLADGWEVVEVYDRGVADRVGVRLRQTSIPRSCAVLRVNVEHGLAIQNTVAAAERPPGGGDRHLSEWYAAGFDVVSHVRYGRPLLGDLEIYGMCKVLL